MKQLFYACFDASYLLSPKCFYTFFSPAALWARWDTCLCCSVKDVPMRPFFERFMWFFWGSFQVNLFLMDHFHFRAGNICGQPWVLAALVPQLSTASSGDKAFLDYPSCGLTQKAPFLFSELRSDSGGFVAPCEWDTVPLGFTTAFSGWAYQTILLKAVSWWSGFILISLSFWETYWI